MRKFLLVAASAAALIAYANAAQAQVTPPTPVPGGVSASVITGNIATITALRSNTSATTPALFLQGYASTNDGGEGLFIYDPTDTTTSDDGGMVIVDASGHRWKRNRGSEVSVKWFGATGNGSTDDTTSFQNWINYLRSNQAYLGLGNKTTGDGYIPAGTYKITTSLDCTSSGSSVSGFNIRGAGKLNTVIVDALTENYPVWDLTGMFNMQMRDFQINPVGGSPQSSCCILMSQPRGDAFITYYNRLIGIDLTQTYNAPNVVAALVVQNNDLLVVEDCQISGYRAMTLGWRLPVFAQSSGGAVAQAGGSNTITLASGDTMTNGGYVGYTIRLVSGTGSTGNGYTPISNPVLGQITAYNSTTKVATVDITWPAGANPASGTIYEIYCVKSKFQVAGSHDDITHIRVQNNSALIGSQPLLLMGMPGSIDLGDTYIAGVNSLTADAAGILFAPMYSTDNLLGSLNLFAEMITFENQSNPQVTAFDLIKNAGQQTPVIKMAGTFEGAFATGSAVLRDVNNIGFASVELTGGTATSYQLFNVGGYINRLAGSFRIANPGTVTGGIGRIEFDWLNRSEDPVWIPWVLATTPNPANTGTGMIIPAGPVLVTGSGTTNFSATSSFGFQMFPSPNNVYTANTTLQPCIGLTLPAGMLATNALTGYGRRARVEFGFECSAACTAAEIVLTNNGTSVVIGTLGALSAGQFIDVRLLVAVVNGTTFGTAGCAHVGATAVNLTGIQSTFLASSSTVISINVTSTTANPLSICSVVFGECA